MGMMDPMIVTDYLNSGKISAVRRSSLKTFAEAQSQLAKNSLITYLNTFVAIAGFASIPFFSDGNTSQKAFWYAYLEDIKTSGNSRQVGRNCCYYPY